MAYDELGNARYSRPHIEEVLNMMDDISIARHKGTEISGTAIQESLKRVGISLSNASVTKLKTEGLSYARKTYKLNPTNDELRSGILDFATDLSTSPFGIIRTKLGTILKLDEDPAYSNENRGLN